MLITIWSFAPSIFACNLKCQDWQRNKLQLTHFNLISPEASQNSQISGIISSSILLISISTVNFRYEISKVKIFRSLAHVKQLALGMYYYDFLINFAYIIKIYSYNLSYSIFKEVIHVCSCMHWLKYRSLMRKQILHF